MITRDGHAKIFDFGLAKLTEQTQPPAGTAYSKDAHHSPYHRHSFAAEIISHSVCLYFRFALSFRDVEEMLAQRVVVPTYETIRAWCLKFGQTDANDGDLRGLAISGTSTKCVSRSTEAFITYCLRLTRMAKF